MIKKKEHPRFVVPNYGAKHRKGVKDRWRKQRGIDNKKRVKLNGYGAVPKIGYKNSDAIRYARSDGSYEKLVTNAKELLELKGVQNYSAKFAHDLSTRKKLAMQALADQNNIKVLNRVKR